MDRRHGSGFSRGAAQPSDRLMPSVIDRGVLFEMEDIDGESSGKLSIFGEVFLSYEVGRSSLAIFLFEEPAVGLQKCSLQLRHFLPGKTGWSLRQIDSQKICREECDTKTEQ